MRACAHACGTPCESSPCRGNVVCAALMRKVSFVLFIALHDGNARSHVLCVCVCVSVRVCVCLCVIEFVCCTKATQYAVQRRVLQLVCFSISDMNYQSFCSFGAQELCLLSHPLSFVSKISVHSGCVQHLTNDTHWFPFS